MIYIVAFLVMNAGGATVMFYDKWAAKHRKRRVREATLWLWAYLGAAPGMAITLALIHHKSKKKRFKIGFKLLSLFSVAEWYYLSQLFH